MSKTRVDRWWDTYNAVLTGVLAPTGISIYEAMDLAHRAADCAHGTRAECEVTDALASWRWDDDEGAWMHVTGAEVRECGDGWWWWPASAGEEELHYGTEATKGTAMRRALEHEVGR